ncbi:MAG: division/cell wall cluster transcriptional repressor MraZ [Atopobiaceae bacterium]
MYLTGSKQYNLDAKSRLTLPASYRKDFSDSVCLIPLKDALYGFTPEGFERWVDSFFNHDGRTFDPRNRRDVALRRMLTGNTVTVDIDSAGRVALGKLDMTDPKARERLGLVKDVTVVGVGDHFEVWSTQRWEAEQAAFADDIDALIYGDQA